MLKNIFQIIIILSAMVLQGQSANSAFNIALKQADSLNNQGLYTRSNEILYPFLNKTLTKENLFLGNDCILRNHSLLFKEDSIALYLNKNKSLHKTGKLDKFSGLLLFREGHFALQRRKNKKALELFFESLKIAEQSRNNKLIAQNYNAIGTILFINRNYKESIAYFDRTILLTETNNISDLCGNAHNLKAQAYIQLKEYDMALKEIELGQPLLTSKMDRLFSKILLLQYYTQTKEQLKALSTVAEVLNEMSDFEVFKDMSDLQNMVADIQNESDDSIIPKIREYEKKTEGILRYNIGREAYFEAKKTIAQQDNNDKAQITELKNIIALKDSLYNIEKQKTIEEMNTRFQTEKKQKEIRQLQKVNLEQELTIIQERNRKLTYATTAAIGLSAFTLLFFYAKNRKKRILHQKEIDIVMAKQLENDRIGANLHDQNANILRGIANQLLNEGNMKASQKISEIEKSLRDLSRELVSISFKESSFVDQIITLGTNHQKDSFKIKIEGLKLIKWSLVNNVVKRNLLLVIREGVINAIKHSGAKQMSISFLHLGKNIEVQLHDTGIGFDTTKPRNGIGIRNMKVRINEVKGSINFKSAPKKGTRIQIVLAV